MRTPADTVRRYHVEVPRGDAPGKWCWLTGLVGLGEAANTMESQRLARAVRDDGLPVARQDRNSKWYLLSYDGETIA